MMKVGVVIAVDSIRLTRSFYNNLYNRFLFLFADEEKNEFLTYAELSRLLNTLNPYDKLRCAMLLNICDIIIIEGF